MPRKKGFRSRFIKLSFDHGVWWFRWSSNGSCLPQTRDGDCDPVAKVGRKWVTVSNELDGLERLESILHESAHAADQRASEEAIEEQSHQQAKLLYALGYRLTEPPA